MRELFEGALYFVLTVVPLVTIAYAAVTWVRIQREVDAYLRDRRPPRDRWATSAPPPPHDDPPPEKCASYRMPAAREPAACPRCGARLRFDLD